MTHPGLRASDEMRWRKILKRFEETRRGAGRSARPAPPTKKYLNRELLALLVDQHGIVDVRNVVRAHEFELRLEGLRRERVLFGPREPERDCDPTELLDVGFRETDDFDALLAELRPRLHVLLLDVRVVIP